MAFVVIVVAVVEFVVAVIVFRVHLPASRCMCPKQFRVTMMSDSKFAFGDARKTRILRILRSNVMVREGGGWTPFRDFLNKMDPCRIPKSPKRKQPQPTQQSGMLFGLRGLALSSFLHLCDCFCCCYFWCLLLLLFLPFRRYGCCCCCCILVVSFFFFFFSFIAVFSRLYAIL